jgi:hypothetical protein
VNASDLTEMATLYLPFFLLSRKLIDEEKFCDLFSLTFSEHCEHISLACVCGYASEIDPLASMIVERIQIELYVHTG